jgi:hypothetical protein
LAVLKEVSDVAQAINAFSRTSRAINETLLPVTSVIDQFVNVDSADIDGTLIQSVGNDSNKLHKDAFSAAFEKVFGIQTHIDVIKHHGGTDPLILIKVLVEAHGIPEDVCVTKLEDMKRVMVEHYSNSIDRCDCCCALSVM